MQELFSEIEINAPAERIWKVLTDFERFPEWNPFIRRADGQLAVGARLHVHVQPSGARGMTFRPTVLRAEPNHELRWLGHLLVPGLFDGEHSFTILPLDGDHARFIQREKFSGVLVPLFAKTLGVDTRRGFEEMNHALKTRAEQAHRN